MPTSRLSARDDTRPILVVIFESAADGIVVIDTAGRIEAFNPAPERLFGYSEPKSLAETSAMLIPAPVREEHDEHVAR